MIVRTLGTGPNLALVHGWGLGSAVWAAVAETLAQHCRVHLVDLPGYGKAPADDGDFLKTAQTLATALPHGTTLCGWSLGGMLALQAALLAPQRIARLILIGATPSFAQRADWTAAQPPTLLDTFAAAVAQDPGTTLQRFVALLNQGDAQARRLTRALATSALGSNLPEAATLRHGLDWLRDVDLRARVHAITAPTLLIHGELDPLMPLAAGQWLADHLPDACLESFAGTAHAPFIADPQRFAAQVIAFCTTPR